MKLQLFRDLIVLLYLSPVQALVPHSQYKPKQEPQRLGVIRPRQGYSVAAHQWKSNGWITGSDSAGTATRRYLSINENDDDEIFLQCDLQGRRLGSSRSTMLMDSNDKNMKSKLGGRNATSSSSASSSFLDDLTPPPFNFARDSILFSENPATRRNNAMTQLWNLCQQYLPSIMTGVWPWRDVSHMEHNPFGALYNMFLVRIPTIGIGLVYLHNLWEGHGLIVDFGQGAFEMSPFVVLSVLALILA